MVEVVLWRRADRTEERLMIRTGMAANVDMTIPEEAARIYSRFTSWGIPAKEAMLVMKGLYDTEILTFTKDWLSAAHSDARDAPNMLVLAGPKGVGKTLAAAWAMFHADPALPFGQRWKTENAPRFRHINDLTEIIARKGEAETDRAERSGAKNTKCLVVDDVGAEYSTEPFLAFFDAVMNARYGSMGLTILTTNLTAEQFATRYGPRLYDRIRGRGEWMEASHESLRGTVPA